MNIRTVTVIGANGAMGSAVAAIIASFGNAKVYLICRDGEKGRKAVEKAVKTVRSDCIRERLIPKTFEDLEECIKDSQWIFESTAESYKIKLEINKKINQYRKPGTIVSTGTSGLSINELCSVFDEEGKSLYFGTHFFNPPYNLPLCELIPTEYNTQDSIKALYNYLNQVLTRKVIITKDKPAFLANRIGFQFLNETLQLAEKYKDKGGIDYIDAIFGPFTGRGMAPLTTIDFVGLDIHKAIVENIETNTQGLFHTSFKLNRFVEELIVQGKLGRKSKEGLYKVTHTSAGMREMMVYDIATENYREIGKYSFKYIDKMIDLLRSGKYEEALEILNIDKSIEAKICKVQLIKYIIYSAYISKEAGESIFDAEIAMIYGFNWISPLALLHLYGGTKGVLSYVTMNVKEFEGIEIDELEEILTAYDNAETTIDFRRMIRAHY